MKEIEKITISHISLHKLVKKIFKKIGFKDKDSKIIADVLISAELRGIPSHGISRISDYLWLIEKGGINVNAHFSIIHSTHTTAVLDADNSIGMLAGHYAMEIAIKKAKKYSIGCVAVKKSNHFGIAGYYAMMALEHDMVGLAMTNANPLVCPTQSVSRMLGTNPIAFAVPAKNYPPFVADFSTTPIARGKLALAEKKGEKVPLGYVQDKNGQPSDDPSVLKRGGGMLPLGSFPTHGSHKGYCLAAIVDIVSAIFSGAAFGPFVPPSVPYLNFDEKSKEKGTGHFFCALRIDAFRDKEEFKKDIDKWIETFKNGIPADGYSEVLVPGEPERRKELIYKEKGIPIDKVILDEIIDISEKMHINTKKILKLI